MRKFIIRATALLALASITFAFPGVVGYTPPDTYTNDTPLLEQDLGYYTHFCDGIPLTEIDSIIGTRAADVEFPDTPGEHTCWFTVTTIK